MLSSRNGVYDMAMLKFTHLSSKSEISPLGTITCDGSTNNVLVLSGKIDKSLFVAKGATLTGVCTVTVTGNTAADGTGTDTTIKTFAVAAAVSGGNFACEIDSEEISYAENQAGAEFKSVVYKVNGTNTDTVPAAVQTCYLKQNADLTPTGGSSVTIS